MLQAYFVCLRVWMGSWVCKSLFKYSGSMVCPTQGVFGSKIFKLLSLRKFHKSYDLTFDKKHQSVDTCPKTFRNFGQQKKVFDSFLLIYKQI